MESAAEGGGPSRSTPETDRGGSTCEEPLGGVGTSELEKSAVDKSESGRSTANTGMSEAEREESLNAADASKSELQGVNGERPNRAVPETRVAGPGCASFRESKNVPATARSRAEDELLSRVNIRNDRKLLR